MEKSNVGGYYENGKVPLSALDDTQRLHTPGKQDERTDEKWQTSFSLTLNFQAYRGYNGETCPHTLVRYIREESAIDNIRSVPR